MPQTTMAQDNLMKSEKTNPKQADSTQAARSKGQSEEIDKAPPPANDPVIYLPSKQDLEQEAHAAALEQDAVEAARIGQAQNSALLGAEVPVNNRMASGDPPTAGDPDAMSEQAKVVGEEAIGGTTPTPDQNNVDDIAAAVGIDTQAEQPVGVKDEMDRRDEQRFELDPDSKDPASSI